MFLFDDIHAVCGSAAGISVLNLQSFVPEKIQQVNQLSVQYRYIVR
jgi:hypothetical protein